MAGSRRWDSPRDAPHSRVLERFANFASLFRCDAALREIVHDLIDVPLDGAGRVWLFCRSSCVLQPIVGGQQPPSARSQVFDPLFRATTSTATGHRCCASQNLRPADQLKRHERDHQRRAGVILHLIEKGQRKALRRPIRDAAGIETLRADSAEPNHMLGYAAARTAGYCIRVFRLANSDSGTSFATLAALSAAFS